MHFALLPIGLGYLASYLKSQIADAQLFFIDCAKQQFGHEAFAKELARIKPDVLGITAFTLEIESAIQCCDIAKSFDKNLITVIGGVHVTCVPEEVLSHPNVDFVFRGEAEKSFCQFIKELMEGEEDFSKIPNLGFKQDGKMSFNPIEVIKDIDELPFPDYELLRFQEYPKTYKMKYFPSAPLITSRGCPFPCTYCAAGKISGKEFRSRSPENIIREIQYIKEKYKIREFEIWDDNFTLNKERTHRFCDLLLKEKINLPWWCPNGLRIETLDEELIRKMKASGLYAIAVGVESGSEKIQKDMKKNLKFDKIREIVALGNKYGIRMEGFFILGYPTETRDDILKTIQFSKELPLKRASILLFQPLVGSEIHDTLARQGKLNGIDARKVEYSKPSILPEGIDSLEELKQLQKKAIFEFYLRPTVFFTFLIENLSWDQIKDLWGMVKKYILGK